MEHTGAIYTMGTMEPTGTAFLKHTVLTTLAHECAHQILY